MTTSFIPTKIEDANPEQLRQYAGQFLGIPVEDATDDEVLAKVRAANDGDTIYVSKPSEVATDQTGSPPPDVDGVDNNKLAGGLGHDDPKVRITIHAEERDGVVNNRHKEVGVNGRVWLLKRGESIDIPYRVFLALDNAERTAITHTGEGEVRTQTVKNTPFNVERMPSQAEIKAWHERTDGGLLPA